MLHIQIVDAASARNTLASVKWLFETRVRFLKIISDWSPNLKWNLMVRFFSVINQISSGLRKMCPNVKNQKFQGFWKFGLIDHAHALIFTTVFYCFIFQLPTDIWDPSMAGIMHSMFYIGFFCTHIPGGFLSKHVPCHRRVYVNYPR